jgi:hypothetical protein
MFLGIPVREGVLPETMVTVLGLLSKFPGSVLGIVQGCPWIDIARTEVLAQFLASDQAELLWLDADVSFEASVVETMRAAKADVITASYCKRKPPHSFNVRTLRGEHPSEAPRRMVGTARVIRIESDGLGCCLVQRHVVERLIARHPELHYVADNGEARHWLFQPFVAVDAVDGRRLPACDDKAFFLRALSAGFEVECLVDATVRHEGIAGRLGDVFDT